MGLLLVLLLALLFGLNLLVKFVSSFLTVLKLQMIVQTDLPMESPLSFYSRPLDRLLSVDPNCHSTNDPYQLKAARMTSTP